MRNTYFMLLPLVLVLPWVGNTLAADDNATLRTAPLAGSQRVAIDPKHQQAIDRGIAWLLTATRENGMAGGDIGQPVDLSNTAMVGMALLAEGNTPHGGKHSEELSRVLGGVLALVHDLPPEQQMPARPTLVQRKIGLYADRFLAALFLSEIMGEAGYDEDQEEIGRALDKLIKDICRAQRQDGTWGSESWAPVLGTVLGWECLRSSSSSGKEVNASAKLVGEALIAMLRKDLQRQDTWMHEFYKKASSIRVLYSLNYRDDPTFQECVRQTLHFAQADQRPFVEAGGEEYLAFALVTECLMHEPQGLGREWYPLVSKRLVGVQNADGSWTGHHCIVSRTFCTAAALLSLQAPNRCLSMSNF